MTLTAEPAMGSLESACAPVLQRIAKEESLASLTDAEKRVISVFVAVQHCRTRNMREMFKGLRAALRGRFAATVPPPAALADLPGDEDVKEQGVRLALEAQQLAPLVYDKAWVLFKNPTGIPFYTSDHPVALRNQHDFGAYGNLGLAVTGIEIHLPLTPSLQLWIGCRSIERRARDIVGTYRMIPGVLRRGVAAEVEGTKRLVEAVDTGTPLVGTRDNVIHSNSLQVMSSNRYVYSSTDEFDLVRQMLADQPGWRTGPQIQIG